MRLECPADVAADDARLGHIVRMYEEIDVIESAVLNGSVPSPVCGVVNHALTELYLALMEIHFVSRWPKTNSLREQYVQLLL